MRKTASIKTRITIWYTSLMLVMIAVVLCLVGTLSYRISIDNIKKDIIVQVTRVSERVNDRTIGMFTGFERNRELKNVTIYSLDKEYIAGQYILDIPEVELKEGPPRKETVNGKEYIVFDVRRPAPPGRPGGFWVRGVESVSSTAILGKSMFIIVLILIPLILLLATIGGYYITRKAFSPINSIIETANSICNKGDIKQRIPISSNARKDELYNLSVTLNTMLDRIENLIKQEKQFTSDASHELRTPISVILSQGEYLLDIAETEKEKELAGNIVDKANQMSKLVSGLLLLSRIDQNRQPFKKEKIDLGVLIDVAVDSAKEISDEKNISFLVNADDDVTVCGDEILMLSVVTNLVNNAIKYGKNGGTVRISACSKGDTVTLEVEDDGIGIAQENLEKIWDRFYRVDNVRNDGYGSSGLGLSMVKSIVELHGGKISAESKEGKGTKFVVELDGI